MTPVTNGLSWNRGSNLASATTMGVSSSSTTAHIESDRLHTEASNPKVATWCCSTSVIRLIVAIGVEQTLAASSTIARSSERGAWCSTS
ncbi:hypothetical protein BH11ACT8_BH11ACT8_11670 [soil metagenome]